MIRFSPVLMLASLTACFGNSTPPAPAAPVPAELTAELSAPCPPLLLIWDPLVATLARISLADARTYEECRLRHAGVVNAYVESRGEIVRHNEGRSLSKPADKNILIPP
ncbi:hypothetical protein FIV32_02405 [Sphingomonadales bacterium 58]|uniref:hypothetical protein n=1 Tax=Sphingobium sp. S8 TaxID=2758385 RepID=UPI001919DFA1|nr:hypothetical protein [Sphingobium sp. S8]MBY2957601.1 hypothetical protein [Sphingomonadales bacterium 58]CAD7335415.1 hypothetical protein SPHS8_00496 [Sphingobium sp. S8]